MNTFTIYTKSNAPADSQALVDQSIREWSFLPNLHAVLAESPIAYKAYVETFNQFMNQSDFTPTERQVVFQTANFENDCHYCVPGHSMVMKMQGIDAAVIEAMREGTALPTAKLEALRTYATRLINQRGHLSREELNEFFVAGYSKKQALDVLVGLASKLISNYTNAIADTPIDEPVKSLAWVHPKNRKNAA
jgi:alkylhydroperoxidase family enzyme